MSLLRPDKLTASAGLAPSLDEKIAGLAAFAAEVLALQDARWGRAGAVATFIAKAHIAARDRAARLAYMAEAADSALVRERFAEIEHVGESAAGLEGTMAGRPFDTRDSFRLHVYYGLRLDLDDMATEAAAFRALMRSRDPEAPGLVHALRTQGFFVHGGREIVVGEVSAAYELGQVDDDANDYRHSATITLTLFSA